MQPTQGLLFSYSWQGFHLGLNCREEMGAGGLGLHQFGTSGQIIFAKALRSTMEDYLGDKQNIVKFYQDGSRIDRYEQQD
ncbi:MAG: hypothetical protein ACRYGR_00540 [Janthinobacterium lividum]